MFPIFGMIDEEPQDISVVFLFLAMRGALAIPLRYILDSCIPPLPNVTAEETRSFDGYPQAAGSPFQFLCRAIPIEISESHHLISESCSTVVPRRARRIYTWDIVSSSVSHIGSFLSGHQDWSDKYESPVDPHRCPGNQDSGTVRWPRLCIVHRPTRRIADHQFD